MPGDRWLRRAGAYLDSCAEAWLGYDLPSPRRAVTESGWSADPEAAFCRRCGESVGAGEQTASGCGSCRGQPAPFDRVVRLGRYAPPLRSWVLAIKYRRWADMGRLLGRELGAVLRDRGVLDAPDHVVVPTPMPALRRAYRGIDHARVISDGVAATIEAPVLRVLTRATGPAQTGRSSAQRRRRAGAGMRARRRAARRIDGRPVVLVDDVRTTGATARAAAGTLRRMGAERVVLAVLAVRDAPGRA